MRARSLQTSHISFSMYQLPWHPFSIPSNTSRSLKSDAPICRKSYNTAIQQGLWGVDTEKLLAQLAEQQPCTPPFRPPLHWAKTPHHGLLGECLPGACTARYVCIKYGISSPKIILTLGSPPSRPHHTAYLICKGPCISRNMRIQQHKMSLPPLPTTTLTIVMNWVQTMGQILRHRKKVLQIVWWGGGKYRRRRVIVKKRCPACA